MACTNKSRIFFLSFSLEVRRVQASALAKTHSQKLAVNRKETTARLLSCSRPNFVSSMLAPVFRSFRCYYCHWLPRYTSPSSSSVTWVARSDRGLYVPALLAGIFLYGRKRSGRKLYGLLGVSVWCESRWLSWFGQTPSSIELHIVAKLNPHYTILVLRMISNPFSTALIPLFVDQLLLLFSICLKNVIS